MSQQPILKSQQPVITVDDMTRLDFALNRYPGCDRAVLYQDSTAQTIVYRVAPGSGVPRHRHSRTTDFFVGVTGLLQIRYEGDQGNGIFELKPGAFCTLPPGVRHEVFNPSDTDVACFFLMHTPHEGFDVLPAQFNQLQPMVPTEMTAPPVRREPE